MKTYFALMLVLETMIIGVFAATDVFLFYVFFEAMLIPMYFLIGSFGVGQRQYAAVKFLLYSLFGGLLMLVAVIALYVYSAQARAPGHLPVQPAHPHRAQPGDGQVAVPRLLHRVRDQGAAVAVPHLAAGRGRRPPSPAPRCCWSACWTRSGTFGMIRYCLELFPSAARYFTPLILTLAVIGVLYGAIVAIGQADMKRLIAYTSISHFGFIVLGIFVLTSQGQSGATLYMVNHGLATGGAVPHRRVHDRPSPLAADRGLRRGAEGRAGAGRAVPDLRARRAVAAGAVHVRQRVPRPGRHVHPVQGGRASFATVGIILAAIYILWMYQRTMTGPVREQVAAMPDLKARELWAVGPLIALIIAFGVYPKPLLDIINPAVAPDAGRRVHATRPRRRRTRHRRRAKPEGTTP